MTDDERVERVERNREKELADYRELEIVGSEALLKSVNDPFDYALKLRSGETIRFTKSTIIWKGWIHLSGIGQCGECTGLPYPAPRGIDVRLSDIVWVMDAPEDS